MPKADKDLIKKLNESSKSAFREIYSKYHKQLFAVAFKYLQSKKLAEDAVHDVFLKLWAHRKKLEAQNTLKGFLFTSTKNHVLNMIRKHKNDIKKNMNYAHLKPASQNKTEAKLTYKKYKQVFESALEELPDGKREIFNLKMEQDHTNKEIAEQLDISVNTVKSQYYKASQFIKSELSKHTNLSFD